MEHNTPLRSRFVYGTGGDVVTWTTRLPVRPWDWSTPTIGGSRTAAGGIPASYVVRRDHNLTVTLRLYQNELEDLDGLIEWGQASESFVWYPDVTDLATFATVYLEVPLAGESWEPRRDANYPKVFEMDLTFRAVTGDLFDLSYFANC
jgi:hypothetical protein